MTEELDDMSNHFMYKKYAFLTMDDIQFALSNMKIAAATQKKPDLILDQIIGESSQTQKTKEENESENSLKNTTIIIVRAPTGSTIEKLSPKQQEIIMNENFNFVEKECG